MSTERIDIEIDDKVDANIVAKIKAIGEASRGAHTHVEKLKAQLSGINVSALTKLQTALANNASAIDKSAMAYLKQEEALNKAVLAETRAKIALIQLELMQRKLNETTSKGVTEQEKLARAIENARKKQFADNAQQDYNKLLNVDQPSKNAKASANVFKDSGIADYEAQAKRLKDTLYPLRAAQEAYNSEVRQALTLYKAGAIDVKTYTDAINSSAYRYEAAQKGAAALDSGLVKVAKGSQLARHHLVNLGFQLNDIGVSLASGQNPLTVFVQQGSQIAGIAAQAGVGMGAMARAAAAMLVPFLPLVGAIGAAYGALKLFQSEASKNGKLEDYAKSLGYTKKEIEKLDADTVTFTDTMKGLWKTIDDASGAGKVFDAIGEKARWVMTFLVKVTALTLISWVALFKAGIATVIEFFDGPFKSGIVKPIAEAFNLAVGFFEEWMNNILKGFNLFIQASNQLFGTEFKPFDNLEFGRIDTSGIKESSKSLADTFTETYVSELKNGEAAVNNFYQKFQKNAISAAKKRIKEDNPHASAQQKLEESRASYLGKINAELAAQAKYSGMVADERERLVKLAEIEANLQSKKQRGLSKDESVKIGDLLNQARAAKELNAAVDSIFNSFAGPQKEFNTNVAAANRLFAEGQISASQYAQSINRSKETYLNAIDPERQFNEQMAQQLDILKKFGPEQTAYQQALEENNKRRAEGLPSGEAEIAILQKRFEEQNKAISVNQALNSIYSEGKGALYELGIQQEALNSAFTNGIVSLDEYSRRLVQLQIDWSNLQLQMGNGTINDFAIASIGKVLEGYKGAAAGATDAFGSFFVSFTDGFANSVGRAVVYSDNLGEALNNVAKEAVAGLISALIKLGVQYVANAVLGQSIATTTLATQTAASVAAAATTATAWAPAASMVSLASFGANAIPAVAGISSTVGLAESLALLSGFKDGGYTGNTGTGQIAGVVHGKEFVFDAESTQRIGVGNLEAIRNGASYVASNSSTTGSGASATGAALNVTIENYGTSKDFEVQQISETDIRVIARDEAKNVVYSHAPKAVAAEIRNPNSSVSKSLGQNTQTQRRR